MTREQRKARLEALLAEVRADIARAKAIGKKADEAHEEAMRRRIWR